MLLAYVQCLRLLHYLIDYDTSIKVNVLELRQSVTASQLTKQLVIQNIKTQKNYSKCIGNYEYSTAPIPHKGLFFEISPEDNSPFSKNYSKAETVLINSLILRAELV
ncbi:hypothetical protein ACRAD_15840 [Acinetobacter radioresistens DSM 6976 = NBRC 102413 = CIP 103788]|nr:hypothetical protein ACRAD_15840 [Acinetobacter radioresistens DSM 6976 = NBRC 102413 = CIP 103788]